MKSDRDPVVKVHGLSKSYGSGRERVAVLNDIDLTIEFGQKVSLVGASGSGKSTLLALLAGLLHPDSGSVVVDGVDLGAETEVARARLRAGSIGTALQTDNLIPFLNAQENVELALRFMARRKQRDRAAEMLDRMGVADQRKQFPRQMSGGEAQRVALAVALANDPALLLADEMVTQLDPQTASRVLDEIFSADRAVLFVTHDVELADRADHCLSLINGQVVAR